MKTVKLTMLCLFLSVLIKQASSQVFEWHSQIGGVRQDELLDIAIDQNGDIYSVGFFNDTISVGNAQLISRGNRDILVVKYSNLGSLIWYKQIGGTAPEESTGIAIDHIGNVLITGSFSGTSMMIDSITIYSPTSYGGIFIAKLTSNGNVIWATEAYGNHYSVVNSISLDSLGNAFITLQGSPTNFGSIYVPPGIDGVFTAKCSSSGVWQWVNKIYGTSFNSVFSDEIATEKNGDSYITGTFEDTLFVDSFVLVSNGSRDIYVVGYNNIGQAKWVAQAGGNSITSEQGSAIGVDNNGNVYLGGNTGGNAIIDTFNVGSGAFLAQLSSVNGIPNWVTQTPRAGFHNDLHATNSNEIYTANSGDLVIKYNSLGQVLWTKDVGYSTNDFGTGIVADIIGNVFVVGAFNSTIIFDCDTVISNGDRDMYISKIDPYRSFVGYSKDSLVVTKTNTFVIKKGSFIISTATSKTIDWVSFDYSPCGVLIGPSSPLSRLSSNWEDHNSKKTIGIDGDKVLLDYELLDLNGRVVSVGPIIESDMSINLDFHSSGIYIYRIFEKNKLVSSGKVALLR